MITTAVAQLKTKAAANEVTPVLPPVFGIFTDILFSVVALCFSVCDVEESVVAAVTAAEVVSVTGSVYL